MRTDVNCRLCDENKALDIEADKKFMSYTSLVLLYFVLFGKAKKKQKKTPLNSFPDHSRYILTHLACGKAKA